MKQSNMITKCFTLLLLFFSYVGGKPVRKDIELLWTVSMKMLNEMDQKVVPNDTDIQDYFIFYKPENKVRFLLFTRSTIHDEDYEVLKLGDVSSVERSKFNKSKKTKIIIHGWLSSGTTDFCADMKNAYLMAEDYNIITIDWPATTLYTIARYSVNPVANKVAQFLDFLIEDVKVNINSIHLMGHSLGAHISGIAGGDMDHGKLSRITGFDPAGPLFSDDPKNRIDSSDADFVDIIHTGGGVIGYFQPIGHVDFYPNGGTPVQPGCGYDIGICTHCRSYVYYIETIASNNNKEYLAAPCDSYELFQKSKCCKGVTQMGENVNKKVRGKYFLHTGQKAPFALGMNSITKQCWAEEGNSEDLIAKV